MSISYKMLTLLNGLKTNLSFRTITTTSALAKVDSRKVMVPLPVRDEGTSGEKTAVIDSLIDRKNKIFPDANTNTSLFYGQEFKEIPIITVKVTKNNTILTFSDAKGVPQMTRSCGVDGFKNTRKGTNIAAQTTASVLSAKVVERGIKTVRVTVRGLGPGRMSALKGIQTSGLNVASVTDTTRVSWHPPRPRKARRV